MGGGGLVRTQYSSLVCIFGSMFRNRRDAKFYTIRFRPTGLESWSGVHPFVMDDLRRHPPKPNPKISFREIEPVTVTIPQKGLTLELRSRIEPDEELYNSLKFTHSCVIDITPKTPISLNSISEFIEDCRKLFSLLMARPVSVLSIAAGVEASFRRLGQKKTEGQSGTWCAKFCFHSRIRRVLKQSNGEYLSTCRA